MRESLFLSVVLICGYLAGWGVGQPATEETHQQPIGAYRIHQKTHFQCAGRPSGYYADVEAGCQVYHMCDGLGRQFSYSCPNTTLFQQRMLICDHWYMVNCSRAESNYDANLLIGQRDKPFVTDQENELRTPRPDLLDRPYAADYAGESYRNQYKSSSASQNSLDDSDADQKKHINRKPEEPFVRPNQPYTFATHWSTQHPSKLQLTVNPAPPTLSLNNDLLPPLQQVFAADPTAAHPTHTHDLALSSSQDSRRSEPEANFINSIPTVKPDIKKPVKHYTPPHEHPQYNINYSGPQQVTQPQLPSTGTAATLAATQQVQLPDSTTVDSIQSTVTDRTPQPFAKRPTASQHSKDTFSSSSRGQTKFTNPHKETKFTLGETGRILSRPSNEPIFVQSTPATVPNHSAGRIPAPPLPPSDLLPPFDKLPIYDDASTQGPPIYSQWKIPASGLLPPLHTKISRNSAPDNQLTSAPTQKTPKTVPANSVPIFALKRPANGLQPPRFDAPSTEAPSTNLLQNSQHNLFRKSNLVQTTPSFPLPTVAATEASNIIPAESPAFSQHQHHHKSPTPRSVPPTSGAQPVTSNQLPHARDNHYLELKKLLHIPDYVFPLEADTVARAQYGRDNSVNSFQVKIPLGVNDVADEDAATATATATAPTTTSAVSSDSTVSDGGSSDGGTTNRTRRTPWYGENAACPECHPSFVAAGACEPCVKIRR